MASVKKPKFTVEHIEGKGAIITGTITREQLVVTAKFLQKTYGYDCIASNLSLLLGVTAVVTHKESVNEWINELREKLLEELG
jgi:hypothetical protein